MQNEWKKSTVFCNINLNDLFTANPFKQWPVCQSPRSCIPLRTCSAQSRAQWDSAKAAAAAIRRDRCDSTYATRGSLHTAQTRAASRTVSLCEAQRAHVGALGGSTSLPWTHLRRAWATSHAAPRLLAANYLSGHDPTPAHTNSPRICWMNLFNWMNIYSSN